MFPGRDAAGPAALGWIETKDLLCASALEITVARS